MRKFIEDDFMLSCDAARGLYRDYAAPQPIVDFHSHLSPEEFALDRRWENITQVWLYGDHYKWRAMRGNGVPEEFITGGASDKEKFLKFAETMPRLLRNPLYHWCHLELARFLGIDDAVLSPKTAEEIWERANEKLQGGFSAHACLEAANVEVVCTTDDPIDDLHWHKKTAENKMKTRLFPAFRPDKAFAFGDAVKFAEYMDLLSKASGVKIDSFASLVDALQKRHDFFDSMGCRSSDYGVDFPHYDASFSDAKAEAVFKDLLGGKSLDGVQECALKSALLIECAKMDFESGWVRQMHIGPMRNVNTAMFKKLGTDSGFDCMGEANYARSLACHFDALNSMGKLGRTIVFNINPKDNDMIAALIGSFQDDSCRGKMQLGSGWWFADQIDGMKKQMEAFSAMSLLPNFVGMLTDSRSFLSFARHEYFRRLLCDIMGRDMESGLLPYDMELVGNAVADICYFNAKNYFRFGGMQ